MIGWLLPVAVIVQAVVVVAGLVAVAVILYRSR